MRKLIILAVLPLVACQTTQAGRQAFCKDRLAISISEQGASDVETAANDYDTTKTVADIRQHNEAVEKVCGLVPAPRR